MGIIDNIKAIGVDGKTNPNFKTHEFDSRLFPTFIHGIIGTDNRSYFMQIDASVDLRHDATVTVTQHPVEIGADVSDFAIVNPRQFVLTGRISAIQYMPKDSDWNQYDILYGSANRVSDAWERLEATMRTRSEVDITTNLKSYKNMLITSLSTSQNWRTARVLDFTANLQEIIKVGVKETEFAAEQIKEGDAREQAQSTKDRGEVQTEPVSSAVENSFPSIKIDTSDQG